MRLTLILLVALAFSAVEAQPSDSLRAAEAFARTVESYQSMYMGGEDDDCDEITGVLDDALVFQENGRAWTKAEMVQFCSHLPNKDVIETASSHALLTENLAYDFVSQLYWAQDREGRFRETISRVWRWSEGEWKIVHMDTARSRVVNED